LKDQEGRTNLKILDKSVTTFLSDVRTLQEDVRNVSAFDIAEQVPQPDAVERKQRCHLQREEMETLLFVQNQFLN
jgi:hypothetical protein